jgi:hypothetical protein
MRWRRARSAEAKCLWSSWRGVSDFSTPLCVSARLKLSLARTGAQSDQISPSALQQHAPPRQPSPLFRLPITSLAGHSNLDLLASPARSECFIRVALTGQSGSPEGAMVVVRPSQAAGRKASPGTGPDRDLVTQDGPGVRLSLLDEVRRGRGSACSNWLAVMRQERHNPQYVPALTRRLGSRSVRLRIGGGDRFKTRVRGSSAGAATGTEHDVFDVM